ncbi:hypothetical protein OS493_005842 [Desmophyllum pertusum]|uniref:Uncharacterized protein n=1 Tax=Desmophyllum pertusum TaxID=174260 RepID=A0A9X0CIB8_9CNID|nr:hypothetical protein OS493_005842 [Desmophyllum pertusum]
MSRTLECPEEESIFFHPWFVAEERATFQQELVLQKFPVLCALRCDESDSSRTLLCQALISVTVSVSSRQQENNLLNMVAIMLTSSPTQLLSVQEFIEAIVLPFLNNSNMQGDIPTVLALKLHNTAMEAVMSSISVHLPFLKKHLLPIILCLCEVLNECNVFWDGMAPSALSVRDGRA